MEIISGLGSELYGTNAFIGIVNLKSYAMPEQTTFSWSGMVDSEGYYDTTVSGEGLCGDLGIISDVRVADKQGYKYTLIDGTGTCGLNYDTNKNVSTMNYIEMARLTLDVFYSNLETFYMGVIPS